MQAKEFWWKYFKFFLFGFLVMGISLWSTFSYLDNLEAERYAGLTLLIAWVVSFVAILATRFGRGSSRKRIHECEKHGERVIPQMPRFAGFSLGVLLAPPVLYGYLLLAARSMR